MKKECIAMILAGGSGTRLKPLTKKLAKPAVLFGGKYRIIDFALSNCFNSGIDTLGVLVQYESLLLNSYICTGSIWSHDIRSGNLTILPPHIHEDGGGWYKGTADAVLKNIEFIDLYNPEHVLILSADQIYKMDYSLMLDYHKKASADVTVAVTAVPWNDAGRFGIMNTDLNNRICEFEEKPENPKSNLASMGIYIFKWSVLKKILTDDEGNLSSSNDFGRDIIPHMVNSGYDMFAYPFAGYWRDVGTIKSFWEAHMDLLLEENGLKLNDCSWKIYSENTPQPPVYINHTGKVNSALIGDGCVIYGEVYNSVIFPGVYVGKGTRIIDSVVMSNAYIKDNVCIEKSIIGNNSIIEPYCKVGCSIDSSEYITIIDEGATLPEYSIYSR